MFKLQNEIALAVHGLEGFTVQLTHEKFYTKEQIKQALEKENTKKVKAL